MYHVFSKQVGKYLFGVGLIVFLIGYSAVSFFAQAQTTSLYVDSQHSGGSGTSVNPYQTINQALSQAQAGATIYIRGGSTPRVYAETLNFGSSGTAGNPIRLQPWNAGEKIIVQSAGTITISQSYVEIDGIDFDGLGNSSDLFRINGDHITVANAQVYDRARDLFDISGDYFTLENSIVHDTVLPSSTDAHCLVYNLGANFTTVRNNKLYNCDGDGIQFYADDGNNPSSYTHSALIENNEFYNEPGYPQDPNVAENAIDIKGLNDSTIRGNSMHHFPYWKAFVVQKGPQNLLIEHNIVYDSEAGFEFRGEGGWTQSGHMIRNNAVYDVDLYCLKFDGVSQAEVFNNTLVNCSGNSFQIEGGGLNNSEVRNNLVYQSGGASVGGSSGLMRSHNGWFGAAAGGLSDGTDITGTNPGFVNYTGKDFQLISTSPVIDAGMVVGLPYAGSAPDLGAYEFGIGGGGGTAPAVSLQKTATKNGNTITYTLQIINASGAGNAQNIVLQDPLPAGTEFVSADNGGFLSAGIVQWPSLTSLSAGASVTRTFIVSMLGSNNQQPVAHVGGPYSGSVGQSVAVSGVGSYDPDGTITQYHWSFGDGGTASGVTANHTYSASGTYTVSLTVVDNNGAAHSAATQVTIAAVSDAQSPQATINSPLNNSQLNQASVHVTGVAFDNQQLAYLQWRNVTTNISGIVSAPANAMSWNWSIASVPLTPGINLLRVIVFDQAGNDTVDEVVVNYQPQASGPVVTIINPSNNSTVFGNSVTVQYGQSGDLSEVSHTHLQLDAQAEVLDLDNDGEYIFTNVSEGSHSVTVYMARSDHSQIGTPVSVSFTVDATQPTGDYTYSVQSGLWSDGNTWSNGVPSTGDNVMIMPGHRVVYDMNSATHIRFIHNRGEFEFDRTRDTRLVVGMITNHAFESVDPNMLCNDHNHIHGQAADDPIMTIGTAENPLPAQVTARIELRAGFGLDPNCAPAIITHQGRMYVHGSEVTSWTKLAQTTSGNTLQLQSAPQGWTSGARVLVVGTPGQGSLHDNFDSSNRGNAGKFQNEVRTISSVSGNTVNLTSSLSYQHLGYQADPFIPGTEVALLDRNIIITSANPGGDRGHIMYHIGGRGYIAYAQVDQLGKEGVLGRYAIHWHRPKDSIRGSYVLGNSILDSYNRWVTIHETDYLLLQDNVGYESVGHGFFLENGNETRNFLYQNLGVQAYVGPVMTGQETDFDKNNGAGFWATNLYNSFVGNVAAANEQWQWLFEAGDGFTATVLTDSGSYEPRNILTLPFQRFLDNQAHGGELYNLEVESTYRSPANNPSVYENYRGWRSWYCFTPDGDNAYIINSGATDCAYGLYRHNPQNTRIEGWDAWDTSNYGISSGNKEPDGTMTISGLRVRETNVGIRVNAKDQRNGPLYMHFGPQRSDYDVFNNNNEIDIRSDGSHLDSPNMVLFLYEYYSNGDTLVLKPRENVNNDYPYGNTSDNFEGFSSARVSQSTASWPGHLITRADVGEFSDPATAIIKPQPWQVVSLTNGMIVVEGWSTDNVAVASVSVNGVAAEALAPQFRRWRATIPAQVSNSFQITARATDVNGNIEANAHLITVKVQN